MPRIDKAFTGLFLLSGVCLVAGTYIAANEVTGDPLNSSPLVVVAGAVLVAIGLAALLAGIKSYRRHRAVILHITRRPEDRRRVRVRKKKSPSI